MWLKTKADSLVNLSKALFVEIVGSGETPDKTRCWIVIATFPGHPEDSQIDLATFKTYKEAREYLQYVYQYLIAGADLDR